MGNILCIDEFMTSRERAYLKYGDEQYLRTCENLYGVDINNLSIYFWTLYLIDLFKENIEKKYKDIGDIECISEDIVNLLKEDRKRIVLYGYTQGYIRGYKDSVLTNEFKEICEKVLEDRNRKSIHIGIVMESDRVHNYHEFIKDRIINTEDISNLINNIKKHCSKNIWNKIDTIQFDIDKHNLHDIVIDILIKDVFKKYNDGIWDGIIYKVIKKTWKNNKITL
ncbi:MAG: hypothetical protein ACRDB0_02205 [Paraclostridium sp.]